METDTRGTGRYFQRYPIFQHGVDSREKTAHSYFDLPRSRVARYFFLLVQYMCFFLLILTIVVPYYTHVSTVPVHEQYLEYINFANIYTVGDPTIRHITEIYMGANACICLVRSTISKDIALPIILLLLLLSDRFMIFATVIFFEDRLVSKVRKISKVYGKLTTLGAMTWAFVIAQVFLQKHGLEDIAIPYIFYVTLTYVDTDSIPFHLAFLVLLVSLGWSVVKCVRKSMKTRQKRFDPGSPEFQRLVRTAVESLRPQ